MELLLVEDDAQVSELLERVLEEAGHDVTLARTLAEADQALAVGSFDMVVLDWMLPDGDGLALCGQLHKRQPPLPVLMLTSRGEVSDRVLGLRTGADDYLTKPFEVDELLARLEAIHRRVRRSWITQVGPLEIDRRDHFVRSSSSGKRFDLTAREYAVLACLAETPDECVARQTLFVTVWNTSFDPGSGVIDVQVSRLRDKLGDLAWTVETVRGLGFRLRTSHEG